MLKVELNKKSANPFYGLRACLDLYQNASKGVVNEGQLASCWREVQEDKEKRQMFFSLLFSIGDITARQHNIFRGKKLDSGGNAQRAAFVTIVKWLKENHYLQYKRFLFAHLFNEFVSFDAILANRVQTVKKKSKNPTVTSIKNAFSGSDEYLNDLSEFVVSVINGTNPSEKHFLAKFLTRPRMSKRKNHKRMLIETRKLMKEKEKFLLTVSEKAGFRFMKKPTHIEFVGFNEWRKPYLGDLESVMFSSLKIKEFDKEQFTNWLDKLPATARYRVKHRLVDKAGKPKEKWGNLGQWLLEWEKFKETKQTEVRVLEEKVRQGTANEEEQTNLVQAKKEAKVTVGAVNFESMFTEIVKGTIDKIKVQPFLDKISLAYNTLVFADDSGSMRGTKGYPFTPFEFATFMATICLMKNPDETGRSLMGFFSNTARLYSTMTSRSTQPNTILRGKVNKTSEPLIDPNLHFLNNLQRMREFANSVMTQNGTNISAIPDSLYMQLKDNTQMIEVLQSFPVWTIISDGNFNNAGSAAASMNDFMMKCQMYFGFKPFVIVIDVASNSSQIAANFAGIENFMFVPPNPAQIEQLLTNFKDFDIMDVYTPLESLYRSNRYELIRKSVV